MTETFAQYRVAVLPGAGVTNLGSLSFKSHDTGNIRLWRIGVADKSGGEFGLGNHSREYALDALVPANVTFRCDTFDAHARTGLGLAQDPDTAWPYAQANAGAYTIQFNGGQVFNGEAQLYVATSMQQGAPPSVALNGVPFSGELPSGIDDPFTRQAVRGAWAQVAMLTIDAGVIVKGLNNLTLASKGAGMTGFDMLALEVPSQ